ncbi:MAG: acylneuraminate cytidylyltransferase [Anaerolineae bacterium]|nr:acylneuraminate cytidylyltransferase [Anaerolineae bacterium]
MDGAATVKFFRNGLAENLSDKEKTNSLNILAIIPARGGSKGIPKKNIKPILGKPLLAYSIEQAWATLAISRVIVSTDSTDIADVAKQYKAEVVLRPAEISGDKASSESALLHVLDHLRETEQYEPDLVVFLQATSPMRQPDDIQNAIETLQRENADSLPSVAPFHGFLWRRTTEGVQSFSYDYQNRQMRQEAPEDFVENGSIYIFKPEILRKTNNRLGGKIAVYPMRPIDSFQIDEPDDLDLIETLMKRELSQNAGVPPLVDVKLLVLDFDGVMTDNRVIVDEGGREAVIANRADGLGIEHLKRAGIEVIVLSKETNQVVAARCRKLNVPYVQGENDKVGALIRIASERNISAKHIAFVGNDVNDVECLQWVGTPIAVSDAFEDVKSYARFVTKARGGYGAVREVANAILKGLSTHER